MALTHSTAARNAMIDAVVDLVDVGTTDATGDLRVLDSPTEVVIIALNNPAFGAGATGVATLDNTGPPSANATAAGAAIDSFEFRDRDNTVIWSGTISGSGGGGDIEATNTNVANGQQVDLTSYTHTAPA